MGTIYIYTTSEDKMRKSAKQKLADYIARKAEDRKEKERLEISPDYEPEVEGYKPERR